MIFRHRTKGGQRSAERVYIYEAPEAVCLDLYRTALMKMYTHKISEVAKWRKNWDKSSDVQKSDRATKGHQRRGVGPASASYVYGQKVPPFEPKKNTEIEKQVADLIDFAYYRCNLPETFWLNEAAKKAQDELSGTKTKGKDKVK